MTNDARFSRVDEVPRWIACLLSFILGIAMTVAVLMPQPRTSEFQRGHTAGYATGWEDGMANGNRIVEAYYRLKNERAKSVE